MGCITVHVVDVLVFGRWELVVGIARIGLVVVIYGVNEFMIGEIRKPKQCPYRLLESGHKIFYNFTSFTYLQNRMMVGGYLDEIYWGN